MINKNIRILLMIIFILVSGAIYSQEGLVKSWEGTLSTGMGKLRVIVNITQDGNGKLAASLDSPDQNVKGITIDSVILNSNNVRLTSPSINAEYNGIINESFNEIKGEWKQAGQTLPLVLKPSEKNKTNPDYFALWQGILKAGEAKLKLIFKFRKTENDSIAAFMDSPDQSVSNIPASKVYYGEDSIFVGISSINGYYTGKLTEDRTKIEGEWVQSGNRFTLLLEQISAVEETKHPQEPKRPFPYNEEEVTFLNNGIKLAGTFTYPKDSGLNNGKGFTVLVMVTGSGPQTRDEEVFGHKPFLVWSDYLTRNGIAVLRYDDRGIGKSTGNFGSATTMDFSTDAIAAVNYLKTRKEVNLNKIGIIGHSEGGLIAPLAANRCKDVSFVILAAGPAVPGDEIIMLQSELISRKSGMPEKDLQEVNKENRKIFDIIKSTKDSLSAAKEIDAYFSSLYSSLPDSDKAKPENSKQEADRIKGRVLNPWFRQFLTFDPRNELVNVTIPVLAMFGENDLQVPPSQNKDEMEKALNKSKSKNYKVIVFPGLNHIFQESETGLPIEYGNIEQTASPIMLETITSWIKGL